MTSCTSMALYSWTPHPETLCSLQEFLLKTEKKNIEDGIKQVIKIYLQRGFKITGIHADSEFEHLGAEMADLGISLNCASKK